MSDDFKKIMILNNEVEARIMEDILTEREIPFILKSYYDIVYDGIYQLQKGWGHIEAAPKDEEEIISIYEEVIK